MTRQEHDRDRQPPEHRHDGEDLVRLSGVREHDDDVAAHDHSEVAVHPLRGVQEVRGRAGGGQGGRDLPGDDSGLAHPRHDHASPAPLEEGDRVVEPRVQPGHESKNGLGLELQHAGRQGAQIRHASVAARMART